MSFYPGNSPPAWITITPSTGWTNYGSPLAILAYRKWSSGLVEIKGDLKSSATSTASGTSIFVLPSGCRPGETRSFAGVCQNTSMTIATAQFDVSGGGYVTPYYSLASVNFVALSISFVAEQ